MAAEGRNVTIARLLLAVAVLACSQERSGNTPAAASSAPTDSPNARPAAPVADEEPTQWTIREVAKRLTDGGLIVSDSGRSRLRQSFLGVDGYQVRVGGSDLQVFIYPDASSRKADSDRIDAERVAPADAIIDWVAPPHLIASGNLIAIHLTPNERLAERVRLILEAWHAAP